MLLPSRGPPPPPPHGVPRAGAPPQPPAAVPIIEASLADGSTGRFIFDTGAEVTVLDQGALERAGARSNAERAVEVHGNAGVVQSRLAVVPRLTVLGLELADVPVVPADLSALPPQIGPIAGILGVVDLLAAAGQVVRIDYAKGRVERLPGGDPTGAAMSCCSAATSAATAWPSSRYGRGWPSRWSWRATARRWSPRCSRSSTLASAYAACGT